MLLLKDGKRPVRLTADLRQHYDKLPGFRLRNLRGEAIGSGDGNLSPARIVIRATIRNQRQRQRRDAAAVYRKRAGWNRNPETAQADRRSTAFDHLLLQIETVDIDVSGRSAGIAD